MERSGRSSTKIQKELQLLWRALSNLPSNWGEELISPSRSATGGGTAPPCETTPGWLTTTTQRDCARRHHGYACTFQARRHLHPTLSTQCMRRKMQLKLMNRLSGKASHNWLNTQRCLFSTTADTFANVSDVSATTVLERHDGTLCSGLRGFLGRHVRNLANATSRFGQPRYALHGQSN